MNRLIAATCVSLLALGGAVSAPVVAWSQTAPTRAAVSTGAAPQMVNLPRGTSFAVDLPADARDVIVSNPQVAEAMLHSPRRITVIGLAPGETDAVFLDAGTVGDAPDSMYMRVGVGTGLRWRSPVGPVQADIAWGAQEKQLRLHLRLGFNF